MGDSRYIYRDDDFIATRAQGNAIPGYLILEPVHAVETIAELAPNVAARLGPLIGQVSAAITAAVGADRVYCLLFAEEKRAIHFHLFPRATWLLEAYRAHLGSADASVSAPQLFEWARFSIADESDLPSGIETWRDIESRLRGELADLY